MSSVAQSLKSSTRRPLGVRYQVGLKATRVSHRHAGWVNVQDPVASRFHRLREDEYFLLTQLDGRCSLEDLQEFYQSKYPNRRVTPSQINSLLFRFHESGLTISNAPGQGSPLLLKSHRERRKKWMQTASSWMFLRLPGVDPTPVMRWLLPLSRPFLSWPGLVMMLVLVMCSATLMILHRDRYVSELPELGSWLTMQNALILAGVIGIAKICHELGHAVVSERFGARCRTIGPMLLIGTPALYCDTSESWMLASRYQRAAVALAGIATEVLIGSIAVWVWVGTSSGLVHAIASNVIIVCGISTVLFNANPLLRYDGYYLLSDLTDVPNLGQRANRRLTRLLSYICLGIKDESAPVEPADESWWLLFYAVAAFVYRWLLMFTIIGFIWMSLRPYGLEIVGQLAAACAVATMGFAAIMPLTRFLKNPANRRKTRMSRFMLTAMTLAAVASLGFIPMSSRVIAPARIAPSSETRVFVQSAGQLSKLTVLPGQTVEKGDELAVLRNPAAELSLVDAEGRYQEQRSRIESLKSAQTLVPEASEHLKDAEALLVELAEQVASAKRKIEALRLTAPCEGIVLEAGGNRRRASDRLLTTDDDALEPDADNNPAVVRLDTRLASWSGLPTDPENQDSFFEAGTELLSIIDRDSLVAEAVLTAEQAKRVGDSDRAEIILAAFPKQIVKGRLISISTERFDPQADTDRRDHPGANRQRFTPETRYIARVELIDSQPDLESLIGASARIRIQSSPRSFWQTAAAKLSALFRFR